MSIADLGWEPAKEPREMIELSDVGDDLDGSRPGSPKGSGLGLGLGGGGGGGPLGDDRSPSLGAWRHAESARNDHGRGGGRATAARRWRRS